MPPSDRIAISGARAHNLKGIDLELPRDALIVITGLSGSGKSSLAFDTIYAEGQRRYVESLSAYARQFLGQMEKPDVDSIEGLSPAISIDQKTTSRNPRSTVGTVTEIYDYLRLLWARIGKPHCYNCGAPIPGQSLEQITDRVMTLDGGDAVHGHGAGGPGAQGRVRELLEEMRAQGYARARIDGELRRLDEEIELDKKFKHDISVVVDRLVMKEGVRKRLSESVEAAVAARRRAGRGRAAATTADAAAATRDDARSRGAAGAEREAARPVFSERFACLNCGTSMPELEPRIFSFNSPHGCCQRCHGLGFQRVIDPELIVPDPTLSISRGRWSRGRRPRRCTTGGCWRPSPRRTGSTSTPPGRTCPSAIASCCWRAPGTSGTRSPTATASAGARVYTVRFDGMLRQPRAPLREHGLGEHPRANRGADGPAALPGLRRRAPAAGEPRGDRRRAQHLRVHAALGARAALEWIEALELTETERAIARLVVREIAERLRFLDSVGIGYLSLERAAATLSGGEAQRIRLATQIGSSLVGVLYILDEPSIGLHQRDNAKLIDTLRAAARSRQHGDRGRARRGHDPRRRPRRRPRPGGRRARRGGGRRGHAGADRPPARLAHRPVPERQARDPGARSTAARPRGELVVRGARQHNLKGVDVSVPARGLLLRHGGLRLGQVDARQRDPLPRGRQPPAPGAAAPRAPTTGSTGLEQIDKIISIDQSPIGRTPRSNPATYTGRLRPHPRPLLAHPGGAGARLQAGAVQLQRQGRALRGLPRRRPDQDRDALPAGRLRPLRAVPRAPLQPRDARGPLQGQVDRRRAGDVGRGGGRVLRPHPEDQAPAADPPRRRASTTSGSASRRPRSRAARRSASSSRPSCRRWRPATPSTSSTSRPPACTSPTCSACSRCSDRLVEAGNTVVVIEHNLDVIKSADRIIDLGPEGGDAGGEVVATGTPEQVAASPASYTGRFLRDLVEPAERPARRRAPARRREPVAA